MERAQTGRQESWAGKQALWFLAAGSPGKAPSPSEPLWPHLQRETKAHAAPLSAADRMAFGEDSLDVGFLVQAALGRCGRLSREPGRARLRLGSPAGVTPFPFRLRLPSLCLLLQTLDVSHLEVAKDGPSYVKPQTDYAWVTFRGSLLSSLSLLPSVCPREGGGRTQGSNVGASAPSWHRPL